MLEIGRVGMIARWRPVHLGHAAVLRALSESAREAVVGIGSSNRYDIRSPFTAEETADMIRLVLERRTNVRLVLVPDLDNGPRWRDMVVEMLGPLDLFVTDNPYVGSLLEGRYSIARPLSLVPEHERFPVDGTLVRREMARGDAWKDLVPPQVAAYIAARRLDARFRREFGLATLALETHVGGAHVYLGR
jgi:nicotinamide-nucleotide adenylyltransferase